jgi:predicted transcriptional regulator
MQWDELDDDMKHRYQLQHMMMHPTRRIMLYHLLQYDNGLRLSGLVTATGIDRHQVIYHIKELKMEKIMVMEPDEDRPHQKRYKINEAYRELIEDAVCARVVSADPTGERE